MFFIDVNLVLMIINKLIMLVLVFENVVVGIIVRYYIVIDVNGGILIYFVIYNFILGGIYFSIVLMCKYY